MGGFPGDSVIKNLSTNTGDSGSLPGLGRSAGVGNNILLQVSCLENYKNRGAWWATVHEAAKSPTRLSMHAQLFIRTNINISFLLVIYSTSHSK